MIAMAFLFICVLCDCFKSRRRLEAEILVLRHQLNVLQQRAPRRLHLRWADRALFIWLHRRCPRILDAVTIVRPETVVRWHRMGFAAYWRWKSHAEAAQPEVRQQEVLSFSVGKDSRRPVHLLQNVDGSEPATRKHGS
jgi:hypothetical protein